MLLWKRSGLVVKGRWISNPEVLGSNTPHFYWMDLCLVVPDSTPSRFVNSQLLSLPPVRIFNKFLFNLQYLFASSVPTISTALLNTSTLQLSDLFCL